MQMPLLGSKVFKRAGGPETQWCHGPNMRLEN